MAVKNFPNVSPDANPSFTLESNTSSFESSLNKSVQHMELPGARWRGSVAFSNRTRQEANKIKAFMASLGGQVGRFYLTPFDAYQNGTMSGNGVVDGPVAFGVSSIPTKGWTGGQDTLFEAGDYIEANGELKMVTDDVAGSGYIEYVGTNYMPSPFDPENWRPDPDGDITNVTMPNPSGSSVVGLAEQTGAGELTLSSNFDNKIPSVLAGEKTYAAIVFKPISGWSDQRIQLAVFSDSGLIAFALFNIENNTLASGTPTDFKFTELSDGFVLLEMLNTEIDNHANVYSSLILKSATVAAPIGSQLYVQAAFFGKADDYPAVIDPADPNQYPANLLATADIPIAPPLRKALTGGEAIITNEPKGKFYLGSNDQSWDINVNGVQSMGFDFIEDVN